MQPFFDLSANAMYHCAQTPGTFQAFILQYSIPFSFQIKDKDFDEYVDIEDNRILDDKSKIIYPQCMVTQAGNFNDK